MLLDREEHAWTDPGSVKYDFSVGFTQCDCALSGCEDSSHEMFSSNAVDWSLLV